MDKIETPLELDEAYSNYAQELAEHHTHKVEQYLELRIRPCPRWLPMRMYKWILHKCVLFAQTPIVLTRQSG